MKNTEHPFCAAEPQTKYATLLTHRLEQLGYQYIDASCDQYTTIRIQPIELVEEEHPHQQFISG